MKILRDEHENDISDAEENFIIEANLVAAILEIIRDLDPAESARVLRMATEQTLVHGKQ